MAGDLQAVNLRHYATRAAHGGHRTKGKNARRTGGLFHLCRAAWGAAEASIQAFWMKDRHFNRANLNVEEPIGRVKRPFSVATGCSARL
jgi:hypothetical protein